MVENKSNIEQAADEQGLNAGDQMNAPEAGSAQEGTPEFDRTVLGFVTRYHRHMLFIVLIGIGIWVARLLFSPDSTPFEAEASVAVEEPVETAAGFSQPGELGIEDLPAFSPDQASGGSIVRLANLRTIVPTRERMEIIKYVVQQGDSLYGIAEKFGLKPHTILWGNFAALEGNVHALSPGQELNILPIDGVLHEYKEGETLSGIANFYGVEVSDIVDWPGNNLDPSSLGSEVSEIPEGTALVVPGGKGEVIDMTGGQITRANPAVASILGPGACPTVYDGPVGTGTFIYPTVERYLSGFDYDPFLHPALDFAGSEGNALFAADTGVIVYAGWNNWGYGNVIVIDHGNGWQTLYAHMAYIPSSVYCGMGVYQGANIGPLGNTGNSSGPHLHFEMRHQSYGKVNPWNFLP